MIYSFVPALRLCFLCDTQTVYCRLTEETTEGSGHTPQLIKERIHQLYKFQSFTLFEKGS